MTLTNVLYIPEIRKNLVSGSLLNSHGFRLVFELDKFVLSKSGMYIEKLYMSDGMWKLNVMSIIKLDMILTQKYKQEVVRNILLLLLMIAPSTVMCTYSKVRIR